MEKQTRTLVIATKNEGKLREFKAVLEPLGFSAVPVGDIDAAIAEPEETGMTFAENAALKATYYMDKTGYSCLADDSGLIVDVLHGRPGVYSARYAGPQHNDADNNAKLLAELSGVPAEKRTARYACVLVLARPGRELLTAEGTCEGIILNTPAGDNGFGYDPYFYIPEKGKTMAEMSLAEKNGLSHRGKALRKLTDLLQ